MSPSWGLVLGRPPTGATTCQPDPEAGRSSSVTDTSPKVSRNRSSRLPTACSPRSTFPARPNSTSESACSRSASRERLAARSTTALTPTPTSTNTTSAIRFSGSATVSSPIGGVK